MVNNERKRRVDSREAWLGQVTEQPLEPELAIVDPHHHLWDHPGSRYMLDEILTDTGSGHRVLATVFVECFSMYRKDGPESLRSVGETEFVNGIAAQSASGQYGETRVAAGIVGFADLALGAAVGPVLQAHLAAVPARFREGFLKLHGLGLSFDEWQYHPQIRGLIDLARFRYRWRLPRPAPESSPQLSPRRQAIRNFLSTLPFARHPKTR